MDWLNWLGGSLAWVVGGLWAALKFTLVWGTLAALAVGLFFALHPVFIRLRLRAGRASQRGECWISHLFGSLRLGAVATRRHRLLVLECGPWRRILKRWPDRAGRPERPERPPPDDLPPFRTAPPPPTGTGGPGGPSVGAAPAESPRMTPASTPEPTPPSRGPGATPAPHRPDELLSTAAEPLPPARPRADGPSPAAPPIAPARRPAGMPETSEATRPAPAVSRASDPAPIPLDPGPASETAAAGTPPRPPSTGGTGAGGPGSPDREPAGTGPEGFVERLQKALRAARQRGRQMFRQTRHRLRQVRLVWRRASPIFWRAWENSRGTFSHRGTTGTLRVGFPEPHLTGVFTGLYYQTAGMFFPPRVDLDFQPVFTGAAVGGRVQTDLGIHPWRIGYAALAFVLDREVWSAAWDLWTWYRQRKTAHDGQAADPDTPKDKGVPPGGSAPGPSAGPASGPGPVGDPS
ncbi:MAG: hypothetical protein GX442_11115 [Candidatus Riflebacteria bacterium]|nr:hypothetical protein [Candidatus Riflebacteria bacterium]